MQNNNRPSVLVDACSIVERSKRQIEVAGSWEHHHHRGHPSTILQLHSIAPPQGSHKWRCSSSSRNSQCDHSQLPSPRFLNFCKWESPILLSFSFFFFPISFCNSYFLLCKLSEESLFPKKSTIPKFQNAIPTTVHTTLFAIKISATHKMCVRAFVRVLCNKTQLKNLSLQQPQKQN